LLEVLMQLTRECDQTTTSLIHALRR
jgi:hypothetical protein